MTPFTVTLAVGIFLFATLIYIYFGMPRLTLATLLSPIFVLFLLWTAFGFPHHFDFGIGLPRGCYGCGNVIHCEGIDIDGSGRWFQDIYPPLDFDSWCNCSDGNCTELAEGIINSPYNDFYKDLCLDHCCKQGNYTEELTP